MLPPPTRTEAKADSTSDSSSRIAEARSATARAWSRVDPGVISMPTWTVSSSVFGWKVNGKVAKAKMVATKATTPIATVFQRWMRVQRSTAI
jgi:hypothetical protein